MSNEQRVKLLKIIEKNEATGLPNHVKINLTTEMENLIAKLTINFSAAALESLRSRILNYFDENRNNKNINSLENTILYELAIKVANDYQIKLGRFIIPELILKSSKKNNSTITDLFEAISHRSMDCKSIPLGDLSGHVLVELSQSSKTIQFEKTSENKNQNSLIEKDLE